MSASGTTGKAFIELRCSNKENTKNAFKNCAQQAGDVVSFGPGLASSSFQNYCSNFPTANHSLDYQKNTCFNYCLQHNLEIAMVEMDDGISAKNPDKLPGLQALLQNIQPGDYLIFTDFSRFSRDATKGIQILDTLSQNGVFIRSILDEISYDTPAARHNARQALSNSQFHSELTSQKIKESIKNIKAKGGYTGSLVPYGYKVYRENNVRKLKEKKSEQVVIKFVKSYLNENQIARGDFKKIADALNTQNHRYRGKSFTPNHIRQIAAKLTKDKPVSYVANQIKREINAINRNQQRKEKRQTQHNINRGITETTPKVTVKPSKNKNDIAKKPRLSLNIQQVGEEQEQNQEQVATYNLRSNNKMNY